MSKAIQIKLLIAILAVLGAIAGLLARGGRQAISLTPEDRQLQQRLAQKVQPRDRHYLIP